MMLPASTCSPPKRFTPRRFEWESRPLRVLPPAFLCAMTDTCYFDLSKFLPMCLHAQIVLAAAEFHDGFLLALAVAYHGREHLATLEQRCADLHIGTFAHEQHLTEFNRGARFCIQQFDA